jgi:tRNA-Thr(GGU) m(6)t(6)A37 methyltransferase TsaA
MSDEADTVGPHTVQLGIQPIGIVEGGRSDRRDDGWDRELATIRLSERFGVESLTGLDAFSHIEVVFRFHGLSDDEVTTDARHPRGNTDWPRVGIFAQRGSKRPNRLGVTICRLVRIDGRRLHVQGLDAIDGTPVLDIKPVMRDFLPRGEIVEPAWAGELMTGYWDGAEIPDDH